MILIIFWRYFSREYHNLILFDDAYIFHAGTKELDKKIITNGGRVLGVTALGDTLEAAIKHAYDVTEKISWKNKYFRTDIGKKGLSSL